MRTLFFRVRYNENINREANLRYVVYWAKNGHIKDSSFKAWTIKI